MRKIVDWIKEEFELCDLVSILLEIALLAIYIMYAVSMILAFQFLFNFIFNR